MGWIGAGVVVSAALVVGKFDFALLVDAPFTAALLWLAALLLAPFAFVLLASTICLITFAAPGVAWVVQYHLPFATAHVWPSLAVS